MTTPDVLVSREQAEMHLERHRLWKETLSEGVRLTSWEEKAVRTIATLYAAQDAAEERLRDYADRIEAIGVARDVAEERLREVEAERDALRLALENCYVLARRERRKSRRTTDEFAGHIVRFCEEAGMRSNLLRAEEEGA